MKNQKQQGDVLFRRVGYKENWQGKGITQGKNLVLVEGEHTGHAHVLDCETDAELIREGEKMLLKLTQQATVVHPEHKPVTLEPGIWEIGRVREYDYLSKMVRPVQD